MLLQNGSDVQALGQVNIDNQVHVIVKLNNATYINGTLVNYIILHPREFKEFSDKIARESAELTNIPKEEAVAPVEAEVKDEPLD